MSDSFIFTYQTRITAADESVSTLDAYAALYGKVERSLFAAMQKPDVSPNALKREFLPRFGITARQFNAIRIALEGKIDSIKVRRPELLLDLQGRIKKIIKSVAKLALKPTQSAKLHQKKRRLHILQTKLALMQEDHKLGKVRLCFGSERLFRAQFDLLANNYDNLEAWKNDWLSARSNQFFVLGSGDESAGNQSCQAALQEDGSLSLQLRLPHAMVGAGQSKHLNLTGIRFAYGQQAVVDALGRSQRISTTKAGKPACKRTGSAMSYRFMRDDKGWRVFVSCEAQAVQRVSNGAMGAIGVDVNADHLAVSETDRFGNLIHARRIDLHTYGKTTEQSKALIGDAAVLIANWAKTAGKPVVVEKLNFAKKRAELGMTEPHYARMLSSFACNKVLSSIKAACFRAGVEVIEVNPAYTSVIGSVNHAQNKGISVHMGAALAVARRGLGLSERVPKREAIVPTRNGGHITLCVAVSNRTKHVWSLWAKVRANLKAAHVAHYRSGASKKPPAPLPPAMRALGAYRSSTVESVGRIVSSNCSADVSFQDVPL